MTGNQTFMKEVAYPYVREVAAFYASYLKRDGADEKYGVPFGCAQELCSGRQSGDKHPQKDDTIDLAYSRWIFSKVWKTPFLGPFLSQQRSFDQARLGTTITEAENRAFFLPRRSTGEGS